MNKTLHNFFCAIIIFLSFSCKTTNYEQYIKPDFTNTEILHKEIENIRLNKEERPVYSLWQSVLLFNESDDPLINDLYTECADYVLQQFYDSVENAHRFDALRYAQSLITANSFVDADNRIAFDDAFEIDVQQAQISYENQAMLRSQEVTGEQKALSAQYNNAMATFITGVVTVWVDLGVTVQGGLAYASRSIGSGFFIDENGYIITNHHVIAELVDPKYEGYARLYIKLSSDSETRIPATVVGWDKTLDLALLKTEVTPPYVYALGSSANLNVGYPIYAIGSPVGLENTITSGIISSFDRKLLSTAAVMQIDAAVNSGNSGGPLIDPDGNVQGVVFAGLPAYQGLNFAIPVEYLKTVLLPLYSGGEVLHAWLGCYGRTYKKFPSDAQGQGVEVLYVMAGSAAYYAGLEKGNIITAVNGVPVTSIEELQFLLLSHSVQSIVSIDYKSSNNESDIVRIPCYLNIRPENPGIEMYKREPLYKAIYPMFGMELVPSSAVNKNQFTVQSIVNGSIADESGFSVHDPVEILRSRILPDDAGIYIETFTKNRKNGYMEVGLAVGAPLDSPLFF